MSRRREDARRREASRPSLVYTLFVRLMRILVPLAALGVVLVMALWPQLDPPPALPPPPVVQMVRPDEPPEMRETRYTGVTPGDQPYTITADKALRIERDGTSLLEMERPVADSVMDDGSWVALTAHAGLYNETTALLLLSGGVQLFHDSGFEFVTDQAEVDFTTSRVWSNQPVEGSGPAGMIDAVGFRVVEGGRRIIFKGPARLVIDPRERPRRQSAALEVGQ